MEHQKVNEMLESFFLFDRVIDGRSVSPSNVCRAVRRLTMIFPFTLSLSLPIILPLYICSRIYTVYIILHTFRLLFSGYVMLYLFSRLGAQSTGPGSPVDYTFIFSISLWCYQTIWHGDISLSWTQFVGYTEREREEVTEAFPLQQTWKKKKKKETRGLIIEIVYTHDK